MVTAASGAVAGCGDGGSHEPAVFALTSPVRAADGTLPVRFTCRDGVSPPLGWSGVPAGTAELAVVAEAVAPAAGTSTRWMAVGIDPARRDLPEAIPHLSRDAGGVRGLRQGVGDTARIGYRGPCDAPGERRLRIRLLALDRPTRLGDGFDRRALDRVLTGAVLAEADLEVTAS